MVMSVEIVRGPKIPEGLASEPLIAALLEDDDTTVSTPLFVPPTIPEPPKPAVPPDPNPLVLRKP